MKLTGSLKKTFHQSVREAIELRHRWHLPARIWVVKGVGELFFEAHPDTVHPGGQDSELLLSLTEEQLDGLAEYEGDTAAWDTEINYLLDRAMANSAN